MAQQEENTNLVVWNFGERTDPESTKTSNIQGRTQTSINGYAMFKKATEAFGPVGMGWGWEIMEERWDPGAPVLLPMGEGQPPALVDTKTHTMKIMFWFELDGKRGQFPVVGHTPAVYRSKHGLSDDGEAPKKSLTDCIKKALSFLGFSADIFLGQWEDADYVAAARTEAEIERAENRDKEIANKRAELTDYVNRHRKAISEAVTKNEVAGLEKTSVLHLTRMQAVMDVRDIATAGIDAVAKAAKLKMDQLKSGEKANG